MILYNTHALACAFLLLLIAHARGQLTPCNAGYTGRGGSTCSACGNNTFKSVISARVEARMSCYGGCLCQGGSSSEGTITDGPTIYSNNQQCRWLVEADGAAISLVFSQLYVEDGFDFVFVYSCSEFTCSTPKLEQKLTGVMPSSGIQITVQNYLLVEFKTDYSLVYNGFSAQYYATTGCTICPLYSGHSLSAQIDITSCVCNKGYTGPAGMQCSGCTTGTYKNNIGSTACTPCIAGTYTNTLAAESCINCPTGKYINIISATVCNDCSAGRFSTTIMATTASTCLDCLAGKYSSNTGVSVCTNCEASKFSTTVGATSSTVCTQCNSGKFSTPGVSACSNCNVGKYFSTGTSICIDCAAGTFNNAEGNIVCLTCPAGKYSSASASTCTDCTAGKFSSTLGATSADTCFNCFRNSLSEAGGTSASSCGCNAGFQNTSVFTFINLARACGGSNSEPCAVMASTNWWSASNLVDGNPNTIFLSGDTSGNYVIIDLQQIVFIQMVRIFNRQDCCAQRLDNFYITVSHSQPYSSGTVCAFSQRWFTGYKDFSCELSGRYLMLEQFHLDYMNVAEIEVYGSKTHASNTCAACEGGKYKFVSGNIQCTTCEFGKFSFVAATSCVECSAGQYSGANSTTCTNCAAGTYAARTGVSACRECLPGAYAAGAGASACALCPTGRFAETPGASDCALCPAGSFSNKHGGALASTCRPCAAGSYAAAGASACSACAAGSFSASANASACGACAAGSFAAAGASACAACAAGSFAPAGAAACTACPFRATSLVAGGSNISSCSVCASGFAPTASGTCACAPGRYLAGEECLVCPADNVKPEVGDGACTPCAPGLVAHAHACVCPANTQAAAASAAASTASAASAANASAASAANASAAVSACVPCGPNEFALPGGPCACVPGAARGDAGVCEVSFVPADDTCVVNRRLPPFALRLGRRAPDGAAPLPGERTDAPALPSGFGPAAPPSASRAPAGACHMGRLARVGALVPGPAAASG